MTGLPGGGGGRGALFLLEEDAFEREKRTPPSLLVCGLVPWFVDGLINLRPLPFTLTVRSLNFGPHQSPTTDVPFHPFSPGELSSKSHVLSRALSDALLASLVSSPPLPISPAMPILDMNSHPIWGALLRMVNRRLHHKNGHPQATQRFFAIPLFLPRPPPLRLSST